MISSIQVYQRRQNAFRATMDSMRDKMNAADPRTGGNETLVLNWGNEQANEVRRVAWERWNRFAKASDRAYHLALHREHESGRFLWCEHCRESSR